MTDNDDVYFAWVLRGQSKVRQPEFMPVVFRDGIAPSGLKYVYAKWKLRSHERWMSLDQLAELYPLKAMSS